MNPVFTIKSKKLEVNFGEIGTFIDLKFNHKKFGKKSIIKKPDESDHPFASADFLMFPFVNRIESPKQYPDEVLKSKGQQDANHLYIHGFYHSMPRKINIPAENHLEMVPISDDKLFPEIKEEIILKDHTMVKRIFVDNSASAATFLGSWGYHPYFYFENGIEDVTWNGQLKCAIPLDEKLLPNFAQEPFIAEKILSNGKLNQIELDHLFKIDPNHSEFFLVDEARSMRISIQVSYHGIPIQNYKCQPYKYLQIYTHPSRQSIAVEPMTSTGNCLSHSQSEPVVLYPGELVYSEFSVSIQEL